MKTPYQLSRDYHLLYQLAKASLELPCWVDYKGPSGIVYENLDILQHEA